VLNPKCTDVCEAEEFIIRDDGGSTDLGYPWAMVFPDGRVLVVYYFNSIGDVPSNWPEPIAAGKDSQSFEGATELGGIRHIAGTWLEP
jgi:hypothetical protein